MPELPDIAVYLEALAERVQGHRLVRVELLNPFLLRSVEPPLEAVAGHTVVGLRRLGKRIAIGVDDGLWLVLHLMVAGRLHWQAGAGARRGPKGLLRLVFHHGTLVLTEAGSKRRASLHVVAGDAGLATQDPGGLEVTGIGLAAFDTALRRENHTLKRALTDPHILSGIGNAYSDEILHAARLSPFALSTQLTADEMRRLHHACVTVLDDWTERLRAARGTGFPEGVTSFRPEMAVHGRYGKPCPVCGTAVQRIRHAEHETNYCPRCQTGGRLLADRALSRLLKKDWPRSIEELERRQSSRPEPAGTLPASASEH